MFKKASEYDWEIPQSHTADQPTTPLEGAIEHELNSTQHNFIQPRLRSM